MPNANPQLQTLFNGHGIATIPLEQKFLLVAKQLALVASTVSQQQFPNGVSSRLDVSITIKDRILIESFGDVGETAETALANNVQNFARNSLHIIIGALQGVEQDEQFAVEQWQINGKTWKAYIGNYGAKTLSNQPVHIPADLFPQIERIIQALPLSKEFHWFRFFFSCNNAKISAAEFLCDNNVFGEAIEELINLDWQLTDNFYSVRLFLMVRRLD